MCRCCAELRSGGDLREGHAWVGRSLRPVVFQVHDGEAFAEGCIVLGSEEEVGKTSEYATRTGDILGAGLPNPFYLWPNRTLPYEIDPAFPSRERVEQAVDHYAVRASPITFVARTAANRAYYPNWVVFRPGGAGAGCSSRVGCARGRQFVTLEEDCGVGNVIHEIGHALGLFHEQSRTDRDRYVTVDLDKVVPASRHNFTQKLDPGVDLGPYDYDSIMHYPPDAFGIDGAVTITPLDPTARIGQRERLSDGDVAALRQLYA